MSKKTKRKAKLSNSSPASTAMHEAKGPSQGQSVKSTAVQLETQNRASSTSEDSESDDVDVQSSGDVAKVVAPASDMQNAKKGYTDSSSEEEDEPVVRKTRSRPTPKVEVRKPIYEVVVVGVVRFMPIKEIQEDAEAIAARRITRRVNGQLEPTTAVVPTYDKPPPVFINIHYECYKTRDYIRQTARCFNCQGWNHRQAGCRKPARCARCGENHKTAVCKMSDESKLKCANCGENHSAAAPICRKYIEVKNAWKLVATEGRPYAEAIRTTSSNKSAMKFIGSGTRVNTRGRTDVIDPPITYPMAQVPTAVRMQWAIARKPPTTRSIECQTDEVPIEQATQTSRDSETQTAEMEEKAAQTSRDRDTQTVEVQEKAVQFEDIEKQAKEKEQEAEIQFFMSTMTETIGKMMEHITAETTQPDWKDTLEKFQFMIDKMVQRGYPMKLATRRSSRRQVDGYRPNSARGSAVRGGFRGSYVS